MAERRAMNKYYPPEWDPSKGSINTFRGQHPLRDRARKLDQGILIVRFEMPFNVWCEGCNAHIGKGVRYNAEKKQFGKYFSTKIWQFRMKCHQCSNWMEIHTDPKNSDFACISGVKKKTEEWEPSEEDNVVRLTTEEEAQKLAEDPFYKLEHANADIQKSRESQPHLQELIDFKQDYKDDFKLSQLARKRYRTDKKELEAQSKNGAAIGLSVPLLPGSKEDEMIARQITFRGTKNLADSKSADKRKLEIKTSSIFGNSGNSPSENAKKQLQLEMLNKKRKLVLQQKSTTTSFGSKPTSALLGSFSKSM